jgi:phage replication-related protein YjqB (UPF0714/DUF867 family)
MPDKYTSFKELAKSEREGVDFRIVIRDKRANTAVVAPHGGSIEPGTSEIAAAIAADDFSFYAFEGLKPEHNRDLHITSTRFDEPRCIRLIQSSLRILTIHGEGSEKSAVFLGGRDKEALSRIRGSLTARQFLVLRHENSGLQGCDTMNICNLGQSGAGIQLELAVGLRRRFFASLQAGGREKTTQPFFEFVGAVREALT